MLGTAVKAPPQVWRVLNYSWVVFFILMGILNLFVLYNFSDETWVYYKTFGGLGLTFLMGILQTIYLFRHKEAEFIEKGENEEITGTSKNEKLAGQKGDE